MELLLVVILAIFLVWKALDSLMWSTFNLSSTAQTLRFKDVQGERFSPTNATEEVRNIIKTATVTICSIVKNEQRYIDEWLLYHKYLGFDHVDLFDNSEKASKYLASLPEKYGQYVRVRHLRGLGMQLRAYAMCRKNGAKNNTWAAFIDADEFIVLRNHSNIKEFLLDVAPVGGSVVLNWSMMGNNNRSTYDPSLVLSRFTRTSIAPNQHVKTIAYLPHAIWANVHNTYMKPGHPTVDQHGRYVNDTSPFHPGNDREIANINHYYTKSWEEFLAKRHRGFAANFKKNALFTTKNNESLARIELDYKQSNEGANVVEDVFARDFFLQHYLK